MLAASSPPNYPPSSSPAPPVFKRVGPILGKRDREPEATSTNSNAENVEGGKKRLFGRSLDVGQLQNTPVQTPSEPLLKEKEIPPPVRIDLDDDIVATAERTFQENLATNSTLLQGYTSSGKRCFITKKHSSKAPVSYERLVASRSETAGLGKAQRNFYGIDIHSLIEQAQSSIAASDATIVDLDGQIRSGCTASLEQPLPSIETEGKSKKSALLWTEKYRAKKFTDLIGDERTHRSVLKWLKSWEDIVFPRLDENGRPIKSKSAFKKTVPGQEDEPERALRKILLLTGPPGLGKTTLAHVCAKQAGYEAVEINASDDRSKDVVNGRIKDCVGTESVRPSKQGDGVSKVARPVCVIVDEVDGVAGGNGGSGEGGFVKALLDLCTLDQRSSGQVGTTTTTKRKKEHFKIQRPLVLICNDLYHTSLRPLRTSSFVEIVHVKKPPLDKIIARMQKILTREGISCETDGVRRLCEAAWGINNRRERVTGSNPLDGDVRSIMVTCEWAARRLKTSTRPNEQPKLTRQWIENKFIPEFKASGARTGAQGDSREVADRVFLDDAGFPKSVILAMSAEAQKHNPGVKQSSAHSVSDALKGHAITKLREVVNANGEHDRIVNDCFASYPSRPFQDDNFLSKPNIAYDWLHFHDSVTTRVHRQMEFELYSHLSSSLAGFHYLFASRPTQISKFDNDKPLDSANSGEPQPFSTARADFEAAEAARANHSILQAIQSGLSLPLQRTFRSTESVVMDLLPYVDRMCAPLIQPVVIRTKDSDKGTASVRRDVEKARVAKSVQAMAAVGINYERIRIEDPRGGFGGFAYRMEPPIDDLSAFQTGAKARLGLTLPVRYAVRQVLHEEHQRYVHEQEVLARKARFNGRLPGQLGEDEDLTTLETADAGSEAMTSVMEKVLAAEAKPRKQKRDFFGRIISETPAPAANDSSKSTKNKPVIDKSKRTWVTFHEGYSNAVKKSLTLKELLAGF